MQTSGTLAGSIPMEIGNLINLEILSLKNGSLTGVIPSSIYNISSLTLLDLSFNKLTGNISSSVGNFRSLQEFYLTQNMFTGSIPREIGNLTLLKLLYLHSNNLTGTLNLLQAYVICSLTTYAQKFICRSVDSDNKSIAKCICALYIIKLFLALLESYYKCHQRHEEC